MKSHLPPHLRDDPRIRAAFRPNVAAVILNEQRQILWCERVDSPGSWQFPQGGIDPGESVEEALWRELGEELGVSEPRTRFECIERLAQPIRYVWPAALLERKLSKRPDNPYAWVGQEQHYFLLRYDGPLSAFSLTPPEGSEAHPEFSSVEWGDVSRVATVIAFKRDAVCEALRGFGFDL